MLAVRRHGRVVIGADGQVSLGNTVMKGNARKVRRLYKDNIIAGFAGGTADAFTLFERFEGQLEKHSGNLTRAAVELAKDWRTDRALRRLEALLIVADAATTLLLSGTGDVIEPEYDLAAIGSGGLAREYRTRRARNRRTRVNNCRRYLRLYQPPAGIRRAGLIILCNGYLVRW